MRPAPVLVHLAIEPTSRAEQTRLVALLGELEARDRDFQVRIDSESGQIILGGTGELHLRRTIETMRRDYSLDLNIGMPQVAYRETIAQQAEIDFTVEQIGGRRAFARVKLSLAPRDRGQDNAFASSIAPGSLPEAYLVAIGQGVDRALSSGVIAGFPVTDIGVTLVDGSDRDHDSSPGAFEAAARSATREGLQKGGLVLLEPVMALEIRAPTDARDSVLGDLRQRRGIMRGQETGNATVTVSVDAPLAQLFNYPDVLRSLSEGRATCAMQFSHYAAVMSPEDDGPYPMAAALRMPAILALGGTA